MRKLEEAACEQILHKEAGVFQIQEMWGDSGKEFYLESI